MKIAEQIEKILITAFTPEKLEVINESHLHAGHAGDDGTGESHFQVRVVSESFTGKSRIERHRMIFNLLREQLPALPHALSIKASTPSETTL